MMTMMLMIVMILIIIIILNGNIRGEGRQKKTNDNKLRNIKVQGH